MTSSSTVRHHRPRETQHLSFSFDDDFVDSSSPFTSASSDTTSPSSNCSSATCRSSFSTSVSGTYFYTCHSPSCCSSFSASSSSSSSGSTSSSKSGNNSSDPFKKTVTTHIRPTLQCIRNLTALAAETMKRYDRLASSKSDLHLAAPTNESSPLDGHQVDSLEGPLPKSTISTRTSSTTDIILESRIKSSSNLESYSSTENIIPPTSASHPAEESPEGQVLWEAIATPSTAPGSSATSSSSQPLQLPSTNTFRSFIKTKTTSGIGMVMVHRKEGLGVGVHHTKMEDDEEVLQLCDSESSASTSFPTVSVASGTSSSQVTSATSSSAPPHQAIFLANPCHSTVSCGCSSSTQTTLTSLDSSTSSSKTLASIYQQQVLAQSNVISEYFPPSPPIAATPPPPPPPSKSRHLRSALIPPLLKPKHFVKHSKGNLLFNVKSGHKSKSKQRLTDSVSGSREALSSPSHRATAEQVVETLKCDRMVVTGPEEDRRRRTIIIEKQNNSFGFTLQTYGIKHCREGEVELITYVDEVTYGGPAFRGGMRPGDVILSINGRDVEKADHRTLVNYIHTCEKTMRLVVLFEDCVRKIELNIKYIKLKKALQQKMAQLEILNQRENQLLLNAALRSRSSTNNSQEDAAANADAANNNNTEILSGSGNQNLKKYRCKSLDVSLDDINCNTSSNASNNNTPGFCSLGTAVCEWSTATPTAEIAAKEYSTTLPRAKGSVGGGTLSESEEEEEEYPAEDEERRTLHRGRRKTSGGTRVGSAGSTSTTGGQMSSRSKSLPQSVANSMDCLTNEAYEDDEDLIGGGSGGQGHGPGLQLRAKSTAANTATHDKDFITKL